MTLRVPLQAWEQATADTDGAELTPQQKWQAGVTLVAALGDPESAAECVLPHWLLRKGCDIQYERHALLVLRGTICPAIDRQQPVVPLAMCAG